MKKLENFKNEKIDLNHIYGSGGKGYGGGLTTGATHYTSLDPNDSWISFDSSGNITGSHNMFIWTEIDEGSYY